MCGKDYALSLIRTAATRIQTASIVLSFPTDIFWLVCVPIQAPSTTARTMGNQAAIQPAMLRPYPGKPPDLKEKQTPDCSRQRSGHGNSPAPTEGEIRDIRIFNLRFAGQENDNRSGEVHDGKNDQEQLICRDRGSHAPGKVSRKQSNPPPRPQADRRIKGISCGSGRRQYRRSASGLW